MDYIVEWTIPKRVLSVKVSGDVSLEDLERLNADMIRHIEQGTAPVHLVSMADNVRHVPTNLMRIKQVVTYLQHPNIGWVIIVQEKANPLTGFMVSVAMQATGMKMRLVKNANDSLETLRRIDQSLEDYISSVKATV